MGIQGALIFHAANFLTDKMVYLSILIPETSMNLGTDITANLYQMLSDHQCIDAASSMLSQQSSRLLVPYKLPPNVASDYLHKIKSNWI
jgi:hypothetical protein